MARARQAHVAVAGGRRQRAEHSSMPMGRSGLARRAAEARHTVQALLRRVRSQSSCV